MASRIPRFSFEGRPAATQWAALLILSVLLALLLEICGLPAALLLGPMLAGIVVATHGGAGNTIRLPRLAQYAARAIIGCLIARVISTAILATFVQHGLLYLAAVLLTLFACSGMGLVLSRRGVLPGTTAVWGLSPGAASVMMMLSESYGADPRLVAFMQYLRVVIAAAVCSIVARLWVGSHATAAALPWFAPVDWKAFAETLAIAAVGGYVGHKSKVPGGGVLLPLVLGAVLHGAGLVELALPQWLRAISYALLGWSIGLGFTRPIVNHALRALPQILQAIVLLILFCGGVAYALVKGFNIDPLTAYLATSPGGMDSVAIIAASTHVDASFVMGFQLSRFLIVLVAGPHISRWVAGHIKSATPESAVVHTAQVQEELQRVKEDEDELD